MGKISKFIKFINIKSFSTSIMLVEISHCFSISIVHRENITFSFNFHCAWENVALNLCMCICMSVEGQETVKGGIAWILNIHNITLLPRTPDKWVLFQKYFSYCSTETYVMGAQKNHLIFLSTHNVSFD